MITPILSSTLLLTFLLAIGLFFFIRASVKERPQQIALSTENSPDLLLNQLQTYFSQRAYQVREINPQKQQITFEGFVRPSWFLAIFLTFLAALGLLCLALVLVFLYPNLTAIPLAITLLAPLAGIFYWQKAGRIERIFLQVKNASESTADSPRIVTVTAHRDELTQLQQNLSLTVINAPE